MSASLHPDRAIAEILIRNANQLSEDEREAIAHLLRYEAVKLMNDGDNYPDGDHSIHIQSIDVVVGEDVL